MYKKYYRPKSPDEALAILTQYNGNARLMAGGTDLVLQLQSEKVTCDAVVDISSADNMRYIVEETNRVRIGAASTHSDLAQSKLLFEVVPFLAEAAGSVGSLQIRNVGTVGGNIVNAQPAADTVLPLLALDAECEVIGSYGKRILPLADLYHPEGGTTLDPSSEILIEISFSFPAEAGGAFGRVARRKALALPVFNTAVTIQPCPDRQKVNDIKIVIAPVARIPFRALEAEKTLIHNKVTGTLLKKASAYAAFEAKPRNSHFRGSADYRKKLVEIVVLRTLSEAWEHCVNKAV